VLGKTQTLPLLVRDRYQGFDTQGAYSAGLVLAFIALTTLFLKNLFKPGKDV
jgi:ABC-type sulfate transport system permease subunit